MGKKPRKKRSWWRRGRTWISVALSTLLAAAVAGPIVWLLAGTGGDASPPQYLDEPASPFTLPTIAGDQVSLADHEGRHNVLLFFSEGMGCAPCWDQIVDLEADWGRFEALDIELVSIMVDSMEEVASEARYYGLTSTVAVDADLSVSKMYDVLGASMHPGVKPGHTFALVNKAGQIIWQRDWGASDAGMMYTDVDELFKSISKWLQKREAG